MSELDVSRVVESAPALPVKRSEPRLDRTTFTTSRLLDFCSEKELTAQTGHAVDDWPLVIVKELVDNALDACEEAGVAPEIDIRVDAAGISISDNGPGMPAETVESILDFSVRVSSREAYVSPTRGAQGNALKTIIAMPFVLSGGDRGVVEIIARGACHRIEFAVDQIRQTPTIARSIEPADRKNGTEIKVHWPDLACSILEEAEARFLQIAADYSWLNPHLTLTVSWSGETGTVTATAPDWAKWKPSDPTSAYWYSRSRFERLIAAYVAHDIDHGRDRTVREFVSEFRGLSGSAKQKAVVENMGLAREPLSRLIRDNAIDAFLSAALLAEMQQHSRAVKPAMLGVIGRDHFEQRFSAAGCEMELFDYRKVEDHDEEGMPFVVEAAFGWLGDDAADTAIEERRMRTATAGDRGQLVARHLSPFRQLGVLRAIARLHPDEAARL